MYEVWRYLSLVLSDSISSERMLTVDSLSLMWVSKLLLVESSVQMASLFSAFSVSSSPKRRSIIIIRVSIVGGVGLTRTSEQ